MLEQTADSAPDPSEQASERARLELTLACAQQTLSADEYLVWLEQVVNGSSYQEIVLLLDRNENWARQTLLCARQKLAAAIILHLKIVSNEEIRRAIQRCQRSEEPLSEAEIQVLMVWYDLGRTDASKMGRDLNRWQARTPLERRLSARLRYAPRGNCLDFDQLTALARRGHRTPNYHAWMSHIVSCPACRRAYLQMRALVRAQRPRLARFFSRLAMPKPLVWASATAGVAAVFAFLFWQVREPATNLAAQPLIRPPATVVQPSNPLAAADARREEADTPLLADSCLTPRPPASPAGSVPASAQELQAASRFGAFVQEAVELLQQAAAQLGTRAATTPPATSGIRLTQLDLESNYSLEPGEGGSRSRSHASQVCPSGLISRRRSVWFARNGFHRSAERHRPVARRVGIISAP